MRFALPVGLMLVLCACQRERPAPPLASDPSPPPAPLAADDRPKIVAFGDSLTAGFGVDPGQSYPDFLQRELDRLGYRYRVVNQGVSGDTSSDGLARLDMVRQEKPAIVVVEFGANDGLRGLPATTTGANLEQIVAQLQQSGAQLLLAGMTLPPNYGPEYIRQFEGVYRDLARRHKLPLIPFLLAGVATTRDMQQDGLHPTVEGNRRVAATVLKALEPLLRH